jgi:cullin 3
MDRSCAEQNISILSEAIDEIHSRNASGLSFEELYRNSYNLVLHKHGHLLYDGVSEKVTRHLMRTAEILSETPDTVLMDAVAASFREHQITMSMVSDILMYMDRNFTSQNKKRPVYDLGLHLYRINVWEHHRVLHRITEQLLVVIASERDGFLTDDRTLAKSIISMLLQLGASDNSNVYERDFEAIFLGTTQEFYRNESSTYLSVNSASDYVNKAKARIEEEMARVTSLALPPTTEKDLQGILETELITRHAVTLVQMDRSGFANMLKDDTKLDEMRNMYDLFSRVPSCLDYLRDAISERIKLDGKNLIADQEKGVSELSVFVRGVLKMRERYMLILDHAFRAERKTVKRVKESFEDFLNGDARAASCLAVYVDELLRVGLKGATETEIDQELQKVIVIFRYLYDKDVFESYYKQHLAKRLLAGKSVSDEAERAMVSLLKSECGYQFTSKLEGMFNDMWISRDTREAYNIHKRSHPGNVSQLSKGIDIEVDVLTAGYWPSQNVPVCELPSKLKESIEDFEKFYLQKYTGRKLTWQSSTGSAEISATFGTEPGTYRRYDLCISTYQMCILMLFNDKKTFTLGEIRSATNIPDMELRRHLISLCTPKHRILRKSSKGKGISSDSDAFSLNDEYTSKLKRVKIPLVSMKEAVSLAAPETEAGTEAPTEEMEGALSSNVTGIPSQVEEDRRHMVEASAVRIMKARKTMHHNDLIAEITKQLSVRFVPSPAFIKKRIESLIEREYLERKEDDRRVYNYVA